ncbi:hypothetical protein PYW07_005819 [Mythimna separata]|uniref:Cytochrome b561 domain-containing protein n=1 Tax=Mythimna separata TaxID=271217 RepID=A0AAD7YJL7_MYTSE|nr:hypothetical protein PYW07_005819 [Mythimna separata]
MSMPPPPPMPQGRIEEGFRPGGPPPDEQVSGFVVGMNVTNTVTHLLLGAVAFTAFICINTKREFYDVSIVEIPKLSAHVYLSVVGYVLLVSQAVLSLNPRSGWGDNFKYPKKTKIYWSIQVLGSFLAILGGILAIVGVKELNDLNIPPLIRPDTGHLNSAHNIVGLVALVLTSVSFVGGLVHLLCSSMLSAKIFKVLYSCIMTLTLIIAFIAICLAFDKFRIYLLTDVSVNMGISAAVLALVGMLMMMIGNLTVAGGKGNF